MKEELLFRCGYCHSFIGNKEEVEEHESYCGSNYDLMNCWTCEFSYDSTSGLRIACDKKIRKSMARPINYCAGYRQKVWTVK